MSPVRARALVAVSLVAVWANFALAQDLPRIRTVRIEPVPVFGPEERLDDLPLLPDMTFAFDIANVIHIDTRDDVIRREMLVREGDLADPDLLAESERNLRNLPFLREVSIVTEPAGPDEVDVVVSTQDTWTTEPRLSFSSGGGSQQSEFGIVEKNFLGRGKRVVLRYREELDRTSKQAQYDDPRLLGSRIHFRTNYEDTSDGRVSQALVEYPFFSLDTPWAGGASYSGIRERNRLFEDGGREIARFRRSQELADGRIGHRLGFSSDHRVFRAGAFYRYVDDDFSRLRRPIAPELLPPDRIESGPGIFFERQVIDFVRERHLNQFDRVEDVNLGNLFGVELGYSAEALGASADEPILRISDRQGFRFGRGQNAFVFGLVTGRYDDGDLENAVFEVEGTSYNRARIVLEHTFVTRLKLDLGRNLDRDVQLFLGNDNGLRGVDTRELVGSKRFIFNLEDRVFVVNDLFHLVSLGFVLFFDSGWAWESGEDVRLASSAGFGFRIGIPRSASEKIFRIDVAVPMSPSGGDQFMPALSFGSGQAFQPFVGPFDLQSSGGG